MKRFVLCFGTLAIALLASTVGAMGQNSSIDKEIEELRKRIDDLEKQLNQKNTHPKPADGLGHAEHDAHEAHEKEHAESSINVTLDVLFSAGTSTERDDVIQQLQGGSHDPNRRGFTLQKIALGVSGQIAEDFRAEAHMVFFIDPEGETAVELEEAFAQTTGMDHGFQIEGGFFLTEFGLINPQHPHDWTWLDQPVAHSRIFGADGLRQAGLQISQQTEHRSWHVGIQQANGETTQSFLGNDELYDPAEADRSIGGLAFADQETTSFNDFIYSARLAESWNMDPNTRASLGGSVLYGPNATGPDGRTLVYGVDFKVEGAGAGPNGIGWVWQTEWLFRDFDVDSTNPNFVTGQLEDWGLYTQIQHWCDEHWAFGLRYELASGSGVNSNPAAPGTPIGRDTDPFRADRHRISPMVTWRPNDSSRIRLQYNFDDSDHLADNVHSVWFGFEFALGGHEGH